MPQSIQDPLLEIQLLGGFHLTREGKPVTGLDAPRLQALLTYLLLYRDTPQSRRQIAFAFWPESSDAQARTNLRQLLYRLRRELPDEDRLLRVEGTALQWQAQRPFRLDVAGFEDALAQAAGALQERQEQAAIAALKQAVSLYQGELLPDCYDEWILPQRERLRQQVTGALQQLTLLLEHRQDYREAIRYARSLLAQDGFQEVNYRRLMRLHAQSGNRAAAVRVYHNCVTVLEREFGVEPAAETQHMVEQLLAATSWESLSRPARPPQAAMALVGRGEEWLALQAAWRQVATSPHMALLAGEAGIGKTHLAEHFLQWVARQGIATAAARCYPREGNLAYAPVVAWLRADAMRPALAKLDDVWQVEIARIVPELVGGQSDAADGELQTGSWQQQRFFDGLVKAFSAFGKPLVLFVDDLHWADRATLAWLSYFMAAPELTRVLVLGTARREETIGDHPLNPFRLRLLATGQLSEIELGPLNREETIDLADKTAGHPLQATQAERFFEETEGNPLFIVESARIVQGAGGRHRKEMFLPPRVQAVIEARLNRLSPKARDVAAIAAAFNGQFSYDLLAHAGDDTEEELVGALDELWRRRLVREVDETDYDFSHGKIREVAYAALSKPRRQYLHRRLAHALETLNAPNLDPVSGRIANHYLRASKPDKAFAYFVRAADHAAGLYAYGEAQSLYAQAISLVQPQAAHEPQLARLYARRGRMLEHAGRFEEAVALYRELKELAERRGDRALTGLALARLVSCYIEPNATHDLQAAEPLISQGLDVARQIADPALEADLLWSQMIRETHYGNTVEAQRIGERCLALARDHGLEQRLGYVLHDLALNLRLGGASQRAKSYAQEAQTVFRKLGNLPLLADSLNQQGLMHILHLEFTEARDCLVKARRVSVRINNRWNLAYGSWLQGMIWYAQGAWDRAREDWRESVQHGEQVGFLTGVTIVRLQQGMLLRQLGDLAGARKRHAQAYEVGREHAPFLLPIAESELARDALAAGDLQAAEEWLAKARAKPLTGNIAKGLFLSSPGLAATELAAIRGKWTAALEDVGEALHEARRRKLAWHEAGLLVARGCCALALGDAVQAKMLFTETHAIAQEAGLRLLQDQARKGLALDVSLQDESPFARQEWPFPIFS